MSLRRLAAVDGGCGPHNLSVYFDNFEPEVSHEFVEPGDVVALGPSVKLHPGHRADGGLVPMSHFGQRLLVTLGSVDQDVGIEQN